MLVGSGSFWIPGIGPILAAGPLAAAIVDVLGRASAVGDLSVLGASLYSLGVPQNSIRTHETALKEDKILVVAHGTVQDVATARDILWTQSLRRI